MKELVVLLPDLVELPSIPGLGGAVEENDHVDIGRILVFYEAAIAPLKAVHEAQRVERGAMGQKSLQHRHAMRRCPEPRAEVHRICCVWCSATRIGRSCDERRQNA